MRKPRFTAEQIFAILAEQERGMATAEVCRRHCVSTAGGVFSDARRLRTLEDENAKLKRLLAEAERDKAMLKDLLGKPSRRPRSSGRRRCSVVKPLRKEAAIVGGEEQIRRSA